MSIRLAVIVPYFGDLPNYFDLWLTSAATNNDIDWFLLTDSSITTLHPNIHVVQTTFETIRKAIQEHFCFEIALDRPYKLCDFKPAYGLVFQDLLAGYDFWGHADVDVIWGRVRNFVTDSILASHDRVFGGGHLSFYRNSPGVNRAFRRVTPGAPLSFREVFSTPTPYAFDEWGPERNGMNAILPANGHPIYLDTMPYADIKVHPRGLRNNREGFGKSEDQRLEQAKRKILYQYDNGQLLQVYLDEEERLGSQEEAYIHLQKRPMKRAGLPNAAEKFVILPPNIFAPPPRKLSAQYLHGNVRERGFYPQSYRVRARNARAIVRRALGVIA